MTKRLLGLILLGVFEIQFESPADASVLQLETPRIFEQSITCDLKLSEGRGEIELAVGELYEDIRASRACGCNTGHLVGYFSELYMAARRCTSFQIRCAGVSGDHDSLAQC